MRLSDISKELFGFDLIQFPFGAEDGIEPGTPEPSSPTKSRLFGSHRRSRSNGLPSSTQTNLLLQQSQTMRDLEELVLGFDALERFAIILERFDK